VFICLSKENEDLTLHFVLKPHYDVLIELQARLYRNNWKMFIGR